MDQDAYLPLLGMGAGLLGAAQPQAGGRQTFGSALGRGLLGGMQGMQLQNDAADNKRAHRLQELQLSLATIRAQKEAAQESARQMAFAQLGAGKDANTRALLAAFPEAAGQQMLAQAMPTPITPYQQQAIDLQRDQLAHANDLTPYQKAQLGLEGQRISLAKAEAAKGAAPDWMPVQDPTDPNRSVYLDKRTGNPMIGPDGQLVRPASQRDAGAGFTQAAKMRDAFEGLTKDPRTAVTAYGKIDSGFKENSGPGDVAGIFGYMKLLDPTSVVREGEFATAENSGGITEAVRNLYNKALSGDRLTPKVRTEILSAARGQLKPYKSSYDRDSSNYTALANSFGVDPATVVTPLPFPDFSDPAPAAPYTPMVPGPGPMGDAPAAPVAAAPGAIPPAQAGQPSLDDWNALFGIQ